MIACLRSARLSLVVLAVIISMAAGGALVFRLVTPGTVSSLATHELIALLGLLLLPVATAWAFFADRRAARRAYDLQTAAATAHSHWAATRAMDLSRQARAYDLAEADPDTEDETGQRSVRSWGLPELAAAVNPTGGAETERDLPGRNSEGRGTRRRHAPSRRDVSMDLARVEASRAI